LLKEKIADKELNFAPNESWDKELGKSMNSIQETNIPLDLSSRNWHAFNDCFGTSEEKHFVKYIDKTYKKLQEKYDEIYLVRNERFFKLYNFEDGKPLEPDYVLFLRRKTPSKKFCFQVFVEPKGTHLKERDAWKEKFLLSLKKEYKIERLWEDEEYRVWGMPFYNKSEENDFDRNFGGELL
jgi:type III restriction enzyme